MISNPDDQSQKLTTFNCAGYGLQTVVESIVGR